MAELKKKHIFDVEYTILDVISQKFSVQLVVSGDNGNAIAWL